MSALRVVGFLPYAALTSQSTGEIALLQELKARGCDVTTVLCDGAFSDCDLHQPRANGVWQRPARACLNCQAEAAGLMAKADMPFRWLGRWLEDGDFSTAAGWLANLGRAEYPDATINGWAMGLWVRSSVQAHVGTETLALDQPHVRMTYASYMNSALLTCLALTRLYDDVKPDALLILNGHMAVLRAASELAQSRGIRVLSDAGAKRDFVGTV